MNTLALVREFHNVFKVPIKHSPDINNQAINMLRTKLLWEEIQELEDALNTGDKVAVLDALTDIQYVLDGAYISLGFQHMKDAAFIRVHKSNMSKLEQGKPLVREDGKILKGSNYQPPNLHHFFPEQCCLSK